MLRDKIVSPDNVRIGTGLDVLDFRSHRLKIFLEIISFVSYFCYNNRYEGRNENDRTAETSFFQAVPIQKMPDFKRRHGKTQGDHDLPSVHKGQHREKRNEKDMKPVKFEDINNPCRED